MTTSRAILALIVVAAEACLGGIAHAQQTRTPLPPVRPQLTPSTTPAAPAVPVAPKPTSPVPNDDADLDPDHPPVLPAASRVKMRACGREWQDMKRRGTDRDMTWKQFATTCLQRAD